MSFHTFGDSHSSIPFSRIANVVAHHLGPILCYTVGRLKHDRTNGLNIANGYGVKDGDTVCFCYGEIDCRCHVNKHITQEKTYQQVIDEIVGNYFVALMENEKLVPNVRMVVYNVVPPCSRHDSEDNPAYPYCGSDEERKAYACYFNEAIRWHCGETGWTFLDVYDRYTDGRGLLSKTYSDGNVHINNPVFIEEFLHTHGLLRPVNDGFANVEKVMAAGDAP